MNKTIGTIYTMLNAATYTASERQSPITATKRYLKIAGREAKVNSHFHVRPTQYTNTVTYLNLFQRS